MMSGCILANRTFDVKHNLSGGNCLTEVASGGFASQVRVSKQVASECGQIAVHNRGSAPVPSSCKALVQIIPSDRKCRWGIASI